MFSYKKSIKAFRVGKIEIYILTSINLYTEVFGSIYPTTPKYFPPKPFEVNRHIGDDPLTTWPPIQLIVIYFSFPTLDY